MEMAQVGEEARRLAVFVGDFAGEEILYPCPWLPEGGSAQGFFTGVSQFGGLVTMMDYRQERDGEVSYQGHGVFGWDDKACCYNKLWADSMGGMPDHLLKGHWQGESLVFQDAGEGFHVRYCYTPQQDGSFTFALRNSQNGEDWQTFMEGNYQRS